MGIHTHDNMSRAAINTNVAINHGVNWVDGTITGMGRGPGNSKTEYLVIEYENMLSKKVNIIPLLELIDNHFKPLMDRCLIKKAIVETKSAGGIILPKANDRDIRVGEVIAAGPGFYADGHFIKNRLSVGDMVLLPEYLGSKIPLEDKNAEFYIYRDSEILATLDKKI